MTAVDISVCVRECERHMHAYVCVRLNEIRELLYAYVLYL